MIDVLDLLGRDTKLLEDVVEHLSKMLVPQTIDGSSTTGAIYKLVHKRGSTD